MEKSYDAFITYRAGQDSAAAMALYEIIKKNDLKPAIDCIDFNPAETFLDEMARCVSQSRYTITLISPRYATSHFTQEEAIMQQILDNREKQRRLIVAYLEDCPAPLWMQSRVGVRLFRDKSEAGHPELKRLLKLLLSKASPLTPEIEQAIESSIASNWSKLPKQLGVLGVYGLAAYGALSAVAALNASRNELTDVASDLSAEVTSIADAATTAVVPDAEQATGAVGSAGKFLKGLIDDLW